MQCTPGYAQESLSMKKNNGKVYYTMDSVFCLTKYLWGANFPISLFRCLGHNPP